MCTVVLWTRAFSDRPLLLAANRDEALDRPAEAPRLRTAGTFTQRDVVAPKDLRSGGTWLGVNDRGLVVALTNRMAGGTSGRLSRGHLVARALAASGVTMALDDLATIDPAEFAPFHLLAADMGGAGIVWSDGRLLRRLDLAPGMHVVTERSFEAAPTARPDLVRARASAWRRPPGREELATMLSDDGDGAGMEGIFVRPNRGYGTRSSSVIEVGAQKVFLHRGWEPIDEATGWTEIGLGDFVPPSA